jgi:fibronectin-binding autotransporter adhesin
MRTKTEPSLVTPSLKVDARRTTALIALSCLIASMQSAYASGVNGLPPVVVHPVHTFTTPVHFSAPHNLSGTQTGANQSGTQTGNQTGNGHSQNTSSSTQTGNQTGNQTGSQSGNQTGNHNNHNGIQNITHHSVATNVSTTGSHQLTANLQNTSSSALQHIASTLPSGGYQLDLTSSKPNIVLGSTLFNGQPSVTINVGGTPTTFTSGNSVTAAEYVAIQQALSPSHNQALILSQNGAADGGQFSLNKAVNANVTGVVVSQGVTAIDYSSKNNSTLTIAGGLTNYGSVIDVSKQNTAGVISATDITNEKGGVISSVLPSSLTSSNSLTGSVDLSLNSVNDINNLGTISSSGALTLASANGSINNGAGATITASNNVNLSAGSGNVTNSGLIASSSGNINITTPKPADININSTGGTFQANAGNVNIRSASYSGSNNVNLVGGNYLSKNLNINSGSGDVEANVGNVSGNINTNAGVEHFIGSSNLLVLGNNAVSGDPTFANNAGGIQISGANNFGANAVSILASGDITDDGTGRITTAGSPVTLIAGATINLNGDTNVPAGSPGILTGAPPTGVTPNNVFVTFTASNGGNIDLASFTSGAVITSGGGNVTLLANSNSSTTGNISLSFNPTVAIDASSATGAGGNVLIVGGAPVGAVQPTISSGSISTAGGPGGRGGDVTITTAQPIIVGGGSATFTPAGTTTATFGASATIQNSAMDVGSIYASGGGGAAGSILGPITLAQGGGNGGNVTLTAGGAINGGFVYASGGGGGGGASNQSGGNGGSGGTIAITSNTGSINIGDLNVSGGGGGGGGGAIESSAQAKPGGTGGLAGIVQLTAGTDIGLFGGNILAWDGGAGGAGGFQGTAGPGGGGGGGGSMGPGAGGGGAGGSGALAADAAAGGGGGGAVSGGGGGGGVFNGGTDQGGSGAGVFSVGIGGQGNSGGFTGFFNPPGTGGPGGGLPFNNPTVIGGAGGTFSYTVFGNGGGGGQTNIAGQGAGVTGGKAALAFGDGSVQITMGGSAGTSTQNLIVETSSLTVTNNGASTTGSAFITNPAGNALTLNTSSVGSQGSLQLTNAGNLTVGAITGGAVALATTGTNNSITVGGVITGTSTSITTVNGLIQTTAAGSVNSTTATLSSTLGNIFGVSGPGSNAFATTASNLSPNTTGQVFISDTTAGNVTVQQINTTANVFSLIATNAAGTGIISGTNGTINAGTLVLESINGSIGASVASPLLINTSAITANAASAGQNVFLSDSSAGNVTVQQSGTLNNAAAGTFSLVASNANGTGILTGTNGTITANAVVLESISGEVGTLANPVLINSSALTGNAAAVGQSVFVSDSTAGNVTIQQSGTINNTAANTFELIATNGAATGIITGTNGIITTNTVILDSVNGSIGTSAASPLLISAALISAEAAAAGQNVFLNDSATGNALLQQDGTVANTAASTFSLVATNAAGSGIITGSNGTITAATVVVESTQGSIGVSTTSPLLINAPSLTANAQASGQSVFLNDSSAGNVTVQQSGTLNNTAASTFSLVATNAAGKGIVTGTNGIITAGTVAVESINGSVGVSAANPLLINAGNVTAEASTGGQSVFLNDAAVTNVSLQQTGSLNNTAGATFSLVAANAGGTAIVSSAGGTITASAVVLQSTNGSVGASLASPLLIDAPTVTANAAAAAQSVFLSDSSATNVTLQKSGTITNTATGAFSLVATNANGTGILTGTNGIITANLAVLESLNGSVGSGIATPVLVNAALLTANAAAAGQTVSLNDSATTNVTLQQSGTINNAAGGSFNLKATNAAGTGILTGTNGTITAGGVVLQSTSGSIGASSGSPLLISAATVAANATAAGQNVFLSDSLAGAITEGTASTVTNAAAGTYQLVTTGTGASISTAGGGNGSVNAQTIVLQNSAAGAGITIANGDTLTAHSITLTAPSGSLSLQTTSLSPTVDGSGNGASIALTGSQLINTGGTALTISANGTGNGNGGKIIVSSGVLNNIANGLVLSANGAGTGSGGTIQVASTSGAIVIGSGSNDVSVSANGTGGTIQVIAGGNLTGGTITATNVAVESVGGTIGASPVNPLLVNSANLTANAVGLNQNAYVSDSFAGNVNIVSATNVVTLGTISNAAGIQYEVFTTNAAGNIVTGGAGKGNVSAAAIELKTSAAGGSITTTAGDVLTANGIVLLALNGAATVAANTLNIIPDGSGNGGNLAITGTTVVVTGNLSANSTGTGKGGSMMLTALNNQLFTIGAASANGVSGSLSTAGATSTTNGFIDISSGGGVTTAVAIPNVDMLTIDAQAGSISVGPQLGAAGTSNITLTATGAGSNITYTNTRTPIIASTVDLSAGGTLGTASSSLLLNAQTVGILTAGGLATITDVSNGETVTNGGGAGTIGGTLGYLGTGTMTFSSNLSAAGTLSVVNSNTLGVSNGNIVVNTTLNATGANSTLNLITNGSGGILGPGLAQGTTVNLTTGSGTIGTSFVTPLAVAATNVAPTSTGVVSITDNQSMTLTGSGISAASSIFLGTTNNGNITVHGQVGGDSTGAVTLNANGTGAITANQDIHGGPLTLISGTGAIGTLNAGALPVVSTNFTSTTGGFSNIIDTQTSTAVTVGKSSAGTSYTLSFAGPGPLSLTNITAGAPIFVADSGNITLGTLTAGTNITVFTQSFLGAPVGNITVAGPIQAGNGGGTGFVNLDALKNASPPGPNSLILVNAASSIAANNGAITLEQDNTTNGSIVIGTGATIGTTGATGGAVNIVIGAVPTTPVTGTAPAGAVVTHPGGGAVFWGTNSISIPTGKASIVLDGSNIVFNTGSLPSTAIILGNGVTITADPTLPAAQAMSAVQGQPSMTFAPAIFNPATPALQGALNNAPSVNTVNSGHVSDTNNNLSANVGLLGAVNSSPVSNALGSAISSGLVSGGAVAANSADSGNTSPANSQSALNSANVFVNSANAAAITPAFKIQDGTWISDTELVTGRIPAVFSGDDDFGVKPDISTIVEMEEEDATGISQANASASGLTVKANMPLTGSVSQTVGGAKVVNLKRGSVVFAPSRDTIVNTAFGSVKIDAKSLVFVMSFRHGLAIFDLDDSHGKAVVVKAGSRELVLHPGMHAMITHESINDFEEVNPAQLIGHRNIRNREIGQGMKAFVSEFSVMQAANAVTPLKQLVNSKHARAQKVAGHMLKTAAILSQLNSTGYEQVMRQRVTAYQN